VYSYGAAAPSASRPHAHNAHATKSKDDTRVSVEVEGGASRPTGPVSILRWPSCLRCFVNEVSPRCPGAVTELRSMCPRCVSWGVAEVSDVLQGVVVQRNWIVPV